MSEIPNDILIDRERLQEYSALEDLIFDCDPTNIEQIKKMLPNYDESIIRNLILYCSEVRRFNFQFLLDVWKLLPKKSTISNKKYRTNTFVKYLGSLGLLQTDFKYDLNYLNVFEEDSLEMIVYNDDLDKYLNYIITHNDTSHTFNVGQEIFDNVLQFAAYCGSTTIFNYNIANGAIIDESVAESAVSGGNIQIIEICAKNGNNLGSCLNTAIEHHRNNIIKWILDNFKINSNTNYLITSAESFNSSMFLHFFDEYYNEFKSYGSSFNIWLNGMNLKTFSMRKLQSVLLKAASSGNFEVVMFLLKNEANPMDSDEFGNTVITWAVYYGVLPVIQYINEITEKKPFVPLVSNNIDLD